MNKHRSLGHLLSWKTKGENFSGNGFKNKKSHMLLSKQVIKILKYLSDLATGLLASFRKAVSVM